MKPLAYQWIVLSGMVLTDSGTIAFTDTMAGYTVDEVMAQVDQNSELDLFFSNGQRVRVYGNARPRGRMKDVLWWGPAREGDPVRFNAINGHHGSAPSAGELLEGWTFVRHVDGRMATIKKDAG